MVGIPIIQKWQLLMASGWPLLTIIAGWKITYILCSSSCFLIFAGSNTSLGNQHQPWLILDTLQENPCLVDMIVDITVYTTYIDVIHVCRWNSMLYTTHLHSRKAFVLRISPISPSVLPGSKSKVTNSCPVSLCTVTIASRIVFADIL